MILPNYDAPSLLISSIQKSELTFTAPSNGYIMGSGYGENSLNIKLLVKSGTFVSSNTDVVSPLGTQIVTQIGNLAIVHLRLRLTTTLNADAYLGTVTPHPSAEVYNLLFLNQQDNTSSSIYIDTNGKVVLRAKAPAGFYVLDTSYAIL